MPVAAPTSRPHPVRTTYSCESMYWGGVRGTSLPHGRAETSELTRPSSRSGTPAIYIDLLNGSVAVHITFNRFPARPLQGRAPKGRRRRRRAGHRVVIGWPRPPRSRSASESERARSEQSTYVRREQAKLSTRSVARLCLLRRGRTPRPDFRLLRLPVLGRGAGNSSSSWESVASELTRPSPTFWSACQIRPLVRRVRAAVL